MNDVQSECSTRRLPRRNDKIRSAHALALGALSLGWAATLAAQTSVQPMLPSAAPPVHQVQMVANQMVAEATLPDAPGFSASTSTAAEAEAMSFLRAAKPPYPPATTFQREILAGQQARKMTRTEKVLFGLQGTVSPYEAAGWVLTASYEQIANSSPNYDQTFKGFSQRLGAAAARDASQNIAGESVLAPLLHEDPRYYQLGDGHKFVRRVVYAATRAIFLRTDNGRQSVNFELLGGHLAGASLTQLYYPHLNRSFSEVAKDFATSVGESGVGFEFREFFGAFFEPGHRQPAP